MMSVTREREIRDKLVRSLASMIAIRGRHVDVGAHPDEFTYDHACGVAMEIEDCLVILDEMEE